MPKFEMTIGHSLPAEEAARRIKNELAGLKTQYADKISGLDENWNGNACEFSISAMGFSGKGTLAVKASEIEISADLPFPVILFKGKIESAIRENLNRGLA